MSNTRNKAPVFEFEDVPYDNRSSQQKYNESAKGKARKRKYNQKKHAEAKARERKYR